MEFLLLLLEDLAIKIDLLLLKGGKFGDFVFNHFSQIFFSGSGKRDETNDRFFSRYRKEHFFFFKIVFGNKGVDQIEGLNLSFLLLILGQKGVDFGIHQFYLPEGFLQKGEDKVVLPEVDSESKMRESQIHLSFPKGSVPSFLSPCLRK